MLTKIWACSSSLIFLAPLLNILTAELQRKEWRLSMSYLIVTKLFKPTRLVSTLKVEKEASHPPNSDSCRPFVASNRSAAVLPISAVQPPSSFSLTARTLLQTSFHVSPPPRLAHTPYGVGWISLPAGEARLGRRLVFRARPSFRLIPLHARCAVVVLDEPISFLDHTWAQWANAFFLTFVVESICLICIQLIYYPHY